MTMMMMMMRYDWRLCFC